MVILTSRNTLGAVVVGYNSAAVLDTCLACLSDTPDVEIVVVDNHSSDNTVTVAMASATKVLTLERNTGFSRACNFGSAALAPDHEWVAFVNPDVVVAGSALLRLCRDAPKDADAIAPLITDHRGEIQADLVRAEPTLAAAMLRNLFSSRIDLSARRRASAVKQSVERYVTVEVTSGACLVVKVKAFEIVDGFDEGYFLNMEDVDLCCKIRASGGRVVIDTETVAFHAKGTSSSGITAERRLYECARAEVLFFERNRPAWQTLVAAVTAAAGCLMRSVAWRAQSRGLDGWRDGVVLYRVLLKEIMGSVGRAMTGGTAPAVARAVFIDE